MHTFVENYIVIYVWILSIYVWNSKKVWRATRRTLLRLCESTRSLWQWKWSFSKPENKKLQILHDLNWFLLSSFFLLLNIYKISKKKLQHCLYLTASTFTLFCFILSIFQVCHYEHTPIGYVQNTDPKMKLLLTRI